MNFDIWSFEKKPLPEILSFIVDNRGKTVPTTENGHILIATNCIKNENLYLSYEKIRYLSEETYQNWFRAHPKPGDILFVCKGTPGRVCMVPDPIDFCIAQDMVALRANEAIVYNKYLLVVLRSARIQKQIEQTSVGDVIPHFKKSFFNQLLIPIPPMQIQRIIGDYYFVFSEKVEINNKINDNLQQQLFSLYENMAMTSPCLKEHALSNLCDFQEGYVNPPQTHPEYFDGEVKWLRAVDINESFIIETSRTLTKAGFESAKKSALLFKPNTIAISKSGTIGRLGIIADYMCGNRAVINIAPNDTSMLAFIYCFLKNKQKEFPDMAVGSVQKNLYVSLLEPLTVFMPDDELLTEFNAVGNSILNKIYNNCIENTELANLRDTLLPKFMSGEIDVSAVQL